MFRNIGWAAFLALSAVLFAAAAVPAYANAARPIYACFSPQNAAVIGRLGAGDGSVRHGFEMGACLALPAGTPVTDVDRAGPLWRFRALGAKPYLYAADWAAGFHPYAGPMPPGFERYLPVTANLLAAGRTYAQCAEDGRKLDERIEDHRRRWREYESWSRGHPNNSTPKIVIYLGDRGPKLMREAEDLRREAARLDARCSTVADMEADNDFLTFASTRRA
jgi:hypothetical protein